MVGNDASRWFHPKMAHQILLVAWVEWSWYLYNSNRAWSFCRWILFDTGCSPSASSLQPLNLLEAVSCGKSCLDLWKAPQDNVCCKQFDWWIVISDVLDVVGWSRRANPSGYKIHHRTTFSIRRALACCSVCKTPSLQNLQATFISSRILFNI